jgi:hypothetical protein
VSPAEDDGWAVRLEQSFNIFLTVSHQSATHHSRQQLAPCSTRARVTDLGSDFNF